MHQARKDTAKNKKNLFFSEGTKARGLLFQGVQRY